MRQKNATTSDVILKPAKLNIKEPYDGAQNCPKPRKALKMPAEKSLTYLD